jgi:adenylate cyclase class 2
MWPTWSAYSDAYWRMECIQRRILALGAESRGRVFENNIRYEDEKNTLIRKKSLLRLRRDAKTILTFKSSPPATSREFKVLNELEVEVSDFQTMNRILENLGLHPEQVYEKWRETFKRFWRSRVLKKISAPMRPVSI